MGNGRQPGPMCQIARPMRVKDGTARQSASHSPRPVGVSNCSIAQWSLSDKLLEAGRRAGPKLPAEASAQFMSLFSPENIKETGIVLGFWAGLHFVGVGELADLAMVGIAAYAVGKGAIAGGREFVAYITIASNAQTDADLDRAAGHLARAVLLMGVTAFLAWLLKKGAKPAVVSEELVTVGRWMSRAEYDAMVKAGRVLESPSGGAKGVLYPPNSTSYKAAPKGDVYVEFQVPKSSLAPKSTGQMSIPGPNSPQGRLAVKQGKAPPQMPKATNIKIVKEQ